MKNFVLFVVKSDQEWLLTINPSDKNYGKQYTAHHVPKNLGQPRRQR
jgi:hypothetical protein